MKTKKKKKEGKKKGKNIESARQLNHSSWKHTLKYATMRINKAEIDMDKQNCNDEDQF